jgi:hypothetical protein
MRRTMRAPIGMLTLVTSWTLLAAATTAQVPVDHPGWPVSVLDGTITVSSRQVHRATTPGEMSHLATEVTAVTLSGGSRRSITESWHLTDSMVPVALDTCVLRWTTVAHGTDSAAGAGDPWTLGLVSPGPWNAAPPRPDPVSTFKVAVSTLTSTATGTSFMTFVDPDGNCAGALNLPGYNVPFGNLAITDATVLGPRPLKGSVTVSQGTGPDRMSSTWSWDFHIGFVLCGQVAAVKNACIW